MTTIGHSDPEMPASHAAQARAVSLAPARRLRGDFRLPGDKSISHRSALLAALGAGPSQIRNYSSAEDCQRTLACLAALGVKIAHEPEGVLIEGAGLEGLRPARAALDAGNSGSTMRLLSGILAGQPFTTEITGDGSLQRRPMQRIIEPLARMGARIEAREANFAPLRISGGHLRGIEHEPPVASAQVKSCVLLAGLFASSATTVIERTPTRNHTEIMLRECGAALSLAGERITVTGGQRLRALGDYTVAGDLSSAAFFIAAALLAPDAEIRLRDIGCNPSRTALIEALRQIGARLEIEHERSLRGEPVADILAQSSKLEGELTLRGGVIANLIDEIPILAVIATQLRGALTIREARELRLKESDRIQAIVANLRRMGAEVEEYDDGLRLAGPQRLRGARLESYGDHRIAMAFTVAGLIAEGETEIADAGAAAVSLPEFYQLLAQSGAAIAER
jgi:3-phosphoshikimate 1-carboxyvinyltransferase